MMPQHPFRFGGGIPREFITLALVAILAVPFPILAAGKAKTMTLPDFTKGEVIPAGASHDWNLGATGARGWMYCEKMVTTDARQISITKVDKGSPTDGVLTVGDVILGVGGKLFSFDPRTEFGKSLTLAERMADPSYAKGQNPIPRSLNALALLASGDRSYFPLLKKEAEWGASFTTEAMAIWYYGYIMLFLSEYRIATSDDSVMPGVAQSGLQATGTWMSEFGNWYFDLARGAKGNFLHLGPPEMGNDSYARWDASGSYLLARATRAEAHRRRSAWH